MTGTPSGNVSASDGSADWTDCTGGGIGASNGAISCSISSPSENAGAAGADASTTDSASTLGISRSSVAMRP